MADRDGPENQAEGSTCGDSSDAHIERLSPSPTEKRGGEMRMAARRHGAVTATR